MSIGTEYIDVEGFGNETFGNIVDGSEEFDRGFGSPYTHYTDDDDN